jgi:formylglycine-generating enzyme required for sulfatase activity
MIWIRDGFLTAFTADAQTPSAPQPALRRTPLEFVEIARGVFMMGCLPDDKDCLEDAVPRHRVRLTKGFQIGNYEVTQAQWEAVMGPGSNPSKNKGLNHPVDNVTKQEIHAFLDKLNAQNDGHKYRLPTEAEWEYSARDGSPVPPPASLGDYAWFADNSDDESHPLGLKKPNAWGLYDMLGNVVEWTNDWHTSAISQAAIDPTGPASGEFKVLRGGGWFDDARLIRASYRSRIEVGDRDYNIGFRCVGE